MPDLTADDRVLDRRIPKDWAHVERHPLRVAALLTVPPQIETILNIPRQYRDEYDQGQVSGCLKPGTLIRMADGSVKPIEQVRVFERVVTAEGRTAHVLQTSGRFVNESIYRLELWGHRHLRLTGEHPVLTKRGYIPASEIKGGDWVALTRYRPDAAITEIPVTTFVSATEQARITQTGQRHYAGVVGRGARTITMTALPTSLTLTPALGRVIGLFLAEGCTGKCTATWHFGGHERHTLVPQLEESLRTLFGAQPRVRTRGNGSIEVRLCGKHWQVFWERACATGAGFKRLHPELCSGPRDFLEAVFYGWLAGDGHRSASGWLGVSISRALAMNMYDIAQALGLRPVISRRPGKATHGVRHRHDAWVVEIRPQPSTHWAAEETDAAVWRKVQAVKTEAYAGPVHNLHVDGDNSYVAEGVGVHNCVGASQSWMMSILNRKLYDWTRLYYEAQGRDEWPETPPEGGTSLRAGFDVLRTVGHWRIYAGKTKAPQLDEGIAANQWATTIYEIRASIHAGLPVNFGINWYHQFSSPVKKPRLDDVGKPITQFGQPRFDYWIGLPDVNWGPIDGGHAITCVGVSDRREAVALCNTWGEAYPFLVWVPYRSLERLLTEAGEAGVIVDRVKAPDAER